MRRYTAGRWGGGDERSGEDDVVAVVAGKERMFAVTKRRCVCIYTETVRD